MEIIDIALRLGAAVLAGGALGLNRDWHGQPTGVRTLGIVGLGSALAVMIVAHGDDPHAISRVIQGIITGIGFLCAGVIIRDRGGREIRGLTTAACAWLTACVGAACGAGQWRMVLVSVPLVFAVLILGGPFERALRPPQVRRHDDD